MADYAPRFWRCTANPDHEGQCPATECPYCPAGKPCAAPVERVAVDGRRIADRKAS